VPAKDDAKRRAPVCEIIVLDAVELGEAAAADVGALLTVDEPPQLPPVKAQPFFSKTMSCQCQGGLHHAFSIQFRRVTTLR